uniref:Uncharacterized protein n=1 Tax=Oryza rufipogon TaxID=4529 RepID=A0A0E0PZV0_ORYRU
MVTSSLRKGETRGFGSRRSGRSHRIRCPGGAHRVWHAEEGYIGVRADDSGIDSEPVGLAAGGR